MVLESADHRVIESTACPQAQLLLSNGLQPDLLMIEAPPAGSSEMQQFRQIVAQSSREKICLIMGLGDQRLRKEAADLGIQHILANPVTRGEIESMLDGLTGSTENSPSSDLALPFARVESPKASHSGCGTTIPQIEELGENRFFLAASPRMLEIYHQAKLLGLRPDEEVPLSSYFPRSQNRDRGHPSVVQNQAVRDLADVDVSVLILGESGTGKEVIAHLIHKHSQRSRQKMMNVNCAALPTELLESEFFGHRQGAFTGAIRDRPGKFEQANGGTLLLDEIGEISVQMQAKLLHVLQDGQFTRLGGQESTKVDVRVLAATNVPIEKALREKTFREDLYYRLSAFTINVPPLRERREEIPYLIEETIRRTPTEMKSGCGAAISSKIMDAALLYDWRGNLRELSNFVIRTIIMQDQDAALRELEMKIEATNGIAVEAFPGDVQPRRAGIRSIVRDVKDRTESLMIQEALDACGWNRRSAAQDLNISYRALLYKIQQLRLAPRMPGT
jgi:DNA-binding NtrC family response regulator